MAKLIFSLILGFSSLSFASDDTCGWRLQKLNDGIQKNIKVSPRSYTLAKNALRHYRNELKPENRAYIQEFVLYTATNGTDLGYKVDITDGGDESLVSYYYDAKSKLIYAYWHNQSPIDFWFCE